MNSFHWDRIAVITLGASVPRGPQDHVLSKIDARRGIVRQLVFKGNRLTGAALIGDVDGAGALRALIQTGATPPVGLMESLLDGKLRKAWARWTMARA